MWKCGSVCEATNGWAQGSGGGFGGGMGGGGFDGGMNPPAKLFRNFLETEIESLKRISRVFERNGAFFSRYRARLRELRW